MALRAHKFSFFSTIYIYTFRNKKIFTSHIIFSVLILTVHVLSSFLTIIYVRVLSHVLTTSSDKIKKKRNEEFSSVHRGSLSLTCK